MAHKVIIIGSGCAGSTAAIYCARAGLDPIVFEGPEPGGQLALTTMVENFPGFPEGVMGPDLLELMKRQAERFGAVFRLEAVTSVDLSRQPFVFEVGGQECQAHSLIVASGASAKWLGLESERRLIGHGVSSCATCDGFFFRDMAVAVIGGGDTAMEDALFLTRFAKKVTIIHRRDEFRASRIMAERALTNPKIEVLWDTVVTEIQDPEAKKVEGIQVRNVRTAQEQFLPFEGVFVAIGHRPNTAIFDGQLELQDGYIVVHQGAHTSVLGVFAAGDVHDRHYRQAITAAGAGCRAAMDAEKYLETLSK
jgi:thioredoxin reductase (NADPH)